MKVSVTRACGHEEQVDVFGTAAQRERKIAWYESTVCAECKAAAANPGTDEVEMSYREYKQNFAHCNTKPGSYDAREKTIIVYVPTQAEEVIEDATAEAVEETAAEEEIATKEEVATANPYDFHGTEKQIEYATTIFTDLITTCEANIKKNLQLAKDRPIEVAYYQERVTAYQIVLTWYHQSMEKFRGFEAKEIIERKKFFPLATDLLQKAQTLANNTGTSLIDALKKILSI